jgi:hypothetical protein
MITCGLWLTPRRLVAVMRPADAVAESLWQLARSDDGRHLLVDAIVQCGAELVIAADQARRDAVVGLARKRGVTLWLVPTEIAFAARVGAGMQSSPKRLAGIVAQLPTWPPLRPQLRRLTPLIDHRQLALL